MWSWLMERWVRWWGLDVAVVVIVGAVGAWRVAPGTGIDIMGQLSLADRRNVYTDMLSLTTIFAGLGGVIFAIFIGLQSRSIGEIKEKVGERLLRVWISALLSPWASAFVIIAAKIVDRGGRRSPNEARWVVVAAISLVALQLLRILWVFYQLALVDNNGNKPVIPVSATPATIRAVRRPKKAVSASKKP